MRRVAPEGQQGDVGRGRDRWLNGQDEQYRTLATKSAALENEQRTIRLRGTTFALPVSA